MSKLAALTAVLASLLLAAPAGAAHHARHHAKAHHVAKQRAYGLSEAACFANEADQWMEIDGESYCERQGSFVEHYPHTVHLTVTITA